MAVSSVPERDLATIRGSCRQRIPEHARHQVRVDCESAGRRMTVVERPAPWPADDAAEWTRRPIARLTYAAATRLWAPYWRDRHGHFHLYHQPAPTLKIDDLLAELVHDRTGIPPSRASGDEVD